MEPSISANINSLVASNLNWIARSSDEDMIQVEELIEILA